MRLSNTDLHEYGMGRLMNLVSNDLNDLGDAMAEAKASHMADVGEAAIHILEHFGTASFSSVRGLQHAIVGQAQARMSGLLQEFRRSAIGGDKFRHGQARLQNVVREAFGHSTDDEAAKGLAKAWAETADWLRRLYHPAPSHIHKP